MVSQYNIEAINGVGDCEDCGMFERRTVRIWYKGDLILEQYGDDHLGPLPMNDADIYKWILNYEGISTTFEEIETD